MANTENSQVFKSFTKNQKTRLHFCHLVDFSCFCWFSLNLIRYRKEFNLLLVAGVKWEKVRFCAVVYKSIPNQITNHSDKFIHILLDFNAWNSLDVELSILGKALTQFLKDYTQYAIASVYLMAITLNITITFIRLNQIQTLLCDWVHALPPLLLSLALFRSNSLSLSFILDTFNVTISHHSIQCAKQQHSQCYVRMA